MTWVVSLAILIIGGFGVIYMWWEETAAWNEATRPVPHDHLGIYVAQLGIVQFPRQSSEKQIKEELDRTASGAIEKAGQRASTLISLREGYPEYADLTDVELARKLLSSDPVKWSTLSDVMVGDGRHIELLPEIPPTYLKRARGDHISHLYSPSSSQGSILYTRAQALKAEASGQKVAAAIFSELQRYYDSPRPGPIPFSTSAPLALIVLVLASLPWGAFFLIRWIVRRFYTPRLQRAGGGPLPEAEGHRHGEFER
jgi:hypothetical protein